MELFSIRYSFTILKSFLQMGNTPTWELFDWKNNIMLVVDASLYMLSEENIQADQWLPSLLPRLWLMYRNLTEGEYIFMIFAVGLPVFSQCYYILRYSQRSAVCLHGLMLNRAPYMFCLPAAQNREYIKNGNFVEFAFSEFAQKVTSYLFFCLG